MSSQKTKPKKYRKTPRNQARYSAILKVAESVFAEKGFNETTISEIAKKAGAAEATIYEYFSSKEGLLFSIPEEKTRQNLQENKQILEYTRGAKNKLRVLIFRHLKLYDEAPDYAKIITLILKANRNFIGTKAYKTVQEAARYIIEVIEEGKKSGEFSQDLDPYLVRAMVWGTIEHLATRKSLLGKPEKLSPFADQLLAFILRGIEVPKKEPAIDIHLTLEHKDGNKTVYPSI